jgi:hypothetical protein
VWSAGLVGHSVIWRDQRLELDGEGKIVSKTRLL